MESPPPLLSGTVPCTLATKDTKHTMYPLSCRPGCDSDFFTLIPLCTLRVHTIRSTSKILQIPFPWHFPTSTIRIRVEFKLQTSSLATIRVFQGHAYS